MPKTLTDAIAEAIKEFDWSDYGLDDVEQTLDDPDTQDWVGALAAKIREAAQGKRWEPIGLDGKPVQHEERHPYSPHGTPPPPPPADEPAPAVDHHDPREVDGG